MEYGEFWKKLKQRLKWLDPFTYSDLLLQKINPQNNPIIRFIVELITAFVAAFLLYSLIGLVMGTSMPLVIVVSGSMEPILHRGDVVLLQGIQSAANVKAQEAFVDQPLAGKGYWDFGSVQYFPDPSAPPLNENLCSQHRNRGVYSLTIENKVYRLQTDGDILVYFSQFPGRNSEPTIHRAVLKIHARDGDYFLTKGDSTGNPIIDQDCGRIIVGRPECNCITLYPIKAQEVQGKAIGWIPMIGFVKLILVDDLLQFLQGCPPTLTCQTGCCFP